jgi:hypothetical protein
MSGKPWIRGSGGGGAEENHGFAKNVDSGGGSFLTLGRPRAMAPGLLGVGWSGAIERPGLQAGGEVSLRFPLEVATWVLSGLWGLQAPRAALDVGRVRDIAGVSRACR